MADAGFMDVLERITETSGNGSFGFQSDFTGEKTGFFNGFREAEKNDPVLTQATESPDKTGPLADLLKPSHGTTHKKLGILPNGEECYLSFSTALLQENSGRSIDGLSFKLVTSVKKDAHGPATGRSKNFDRFHTLPMIGKRFVKATAYPRFQTARPIIVYEPFQAVLLTLGRWLGLMGLSRTTVLVSNLDDLARVLRRFSEDALLLAVSNDALMGLLSSLSTSRLRWIPILEPMDLATVPSVPETIGIPGCLMKPFGWYDFARTLNESFRLDRPTTVMAFGPESSHDLSWFGSDPKDIAALGIELRSAAILEHAAQVAKNHAIDNLFCFCETSRREAVEKLTQSIRRRWPSSRVIFVGPDARHVSENGEAVPDAWIERPLGLNDIVREVTNF